MGGCLERGATAEGIPNNLKEVARARSSLSATLRRLHCREDENVKWRNMLFASMLAAGEDIRGTTRHAKRLRVLIIRIRRYRNFIENLEAVQQRLDDSLLAREYVETAASAAEAIRTITADGAILKMMEATVEDFTSATETINAIDDAWTHAGDEDILVADEEDRELEAELVLLSDAVGDTPTTETTDAGAAAGGVMLAVDDDSGRSRSHSHGADDAAGNKEESAAIGLLSSVDGETRGPEQRRRRRMATTNRWHPRSETAVRYGAWAATTTHGQDVDGIAAVAAARKEMQQETEARTQSSLFKTSVAL